MASRRKAEALIAAGEVTVNGRCVTRLGTRVDPEHDHIRVAGRALRRAGPRVYLVLNKPAGVLTTLDPEEPRATVRELIDGRVKDRVFPVGRLDFNTEGVLLLTNDGELANRLAHPSYATPKTYRAKVRGLPGRAIVRRLEEGVRLEDGPARAERVGVEPTGRGNAWVTVTVREGRQHLVKRLLQAVGFPVVRLQRVSFAGVTAAGLRTGELRALTEEEVARLRRGVRRRSRGRA